MLGKEYAPRRYGNQAVILQMWLSYLFNKRQFFRLVKLKAFADNNSYVAQMMIDVFDRFENIAGKGENAGFQHFLLFPQCFLELSFPGSLTLSQMTNFLLVQTERVCRRQL